MKRLLQFFGLGKKAKAKAEPTAVITKTIVPPEPFKESKGPIAERGKSSNDTRWQLKKHCHRKVRAKNRSARKMRTYNKIYA